MQSLRLFRRIQPRHLTSLIQRTQLFQPPPHFSLARNHRIFTTTTKCLCPKVVSKQSTKPLQFYAKEGGSCVFWSGVGIWIIFFPSTQFFSYLGGAQYFIDWVSGYEYGARFVEHARSVAGESVTWIHKNINANYVTQQGIEIFVLGFIVYFCLKPVRYPLWALLTRHCMRVKQSRGIINKPLMEQHKAESKKRGRNIKRRMLKDAKDAKQRASDRIKKRLAAKKLKMRENREYRQMRMQMMKKWMKNRGKKRTNGRRDDFGGSSNSNGSPKNS